MQFNKKELNNVLKGLGVIILYFVASKYQVIPLVLLGINYEIWPQIYKILYTLGFEILLIGTIVYIYRNILINAWCNLKKNHKDYFNEYAKYWILMIAIMIFSNGIIMLISNQSQPANEQLIREMFVSYPLYTFISATLLAPILEELVFRQAFRSVLATKWLYIVLSALVFGGLHVMTGFDTWVDLLYLIPYCTPGIIFAYIMTKIDNIFVPMAIHLFHNGIMMTLLILTNIL